MEHRHARRGAKLNKKIVGSFESLGLPWASETGVASGTALGAAFHSMGAPSGCGLVNGIDVTPLPSSDADGRPAPICIVTDAILPGSSYPTDGVEGSDFSLGVEGMRNIDAELMARWVELLHTQTMVLEARGAQVMAEIRTALGRLIETGPALEQNEPYARGALLGDLARNARNLAASTDAMARYAQLLSSAVPVDQMKVEP